jgi:mycothiol system anti-sigma-R factor
MSRACEHAIEHIYFYLDSEITWYKRLRVRRHLRKCRHCCDAFDFEAHLKALIRQRGHDMAPPELFERLRALIDQETAEEPGA